MRLRKCLSTMSGCTGEQLDVANSIYTAFTGTGTVEDGPYVFDIENRRILYSFVHSFFCSFYF